jgi:outer membrane protein insertion porin family
VALLLFFFPQPVFSWEGKIVDQIEVRLEGVLAPSVLSEAIGFREGDLYQSEKIRQAVVSLYRVGTFRDIEVQVRSLPNQRVAVTFLLLEKRLIRSIDFAGHRRFTRQEIEKTLRVPADLPFEEREWEDRLAPLYALYKREGYLGLQVKTEIRSRATDGAIEIFFQIQEGERTQIKKLVLLGETTELPLQKLIQSGPSRPFRIDTLEEDIQRIRAFYKKKGYWMAVVGPPQILFLPEENGVEIVLPVIPSTRIDLTFNRVDPKAGPVLLSSSFLPGGSSLDHFVQIDHERGATEEGLDESAREIEQFYYDHGYPFVSVSVTATPFSKPKRIEVVFQIARLTRMRIGKIGFDGNRSFRGKQLKDLIRLKKEPFWKQKTRFKNELLQEDIDRLISFYKKEGFQSVQITAEVLFEERSRFVHVLFHVEEGVQTRIRAVTLRGEEQLSAATLFRVLSLRSNTPYNKELVRQGASQIFTAYSRRGYIHARVDSHVTLSPDQTAVDIQYQIVEGRPVFLGSLSLFGNTKTQEPILTREMAIQRGDPYDHEKILQSQHQLSRLGLLNTIHFNPTQNSDDASVLDLRLTVVERPSLFLEFGPGYLETEGLRGFLEVGNRNLFGTGRKISARAEASGLEKKYGFDYKEPRFFSYPTDGTLGVIYFLTQRESFDEEALVGTVGLEKQFSLAWRGRLLYQYEEKEITNVTPGAILTRQDVGEIVIGSVNPSLVRDTRNDRIYPTSGSFHGLTFRNAAKVLGSEVQMVKITHQSSFFFAPTLKTAVAFSARVGLAEQFGETKSIPLSERFFLGGRSTVRGYDQDRLGIEGITVNQGQPTGGNAMVIFNEEFRFPLIRDFGAVLFFDHGNVWRIMEDIKLGNLKSTAGAGLRYNTPIGPFRVDYGYKLDREPYESPYGLHFTIGHAF